MKKLALLLVGMIVCAWLTSGGGSSAFGQHTKSTTKPAPKTTTKVETYVVIQIGEEFKAIPSSQLAAEKKRVAEDYKRDMETYKDNMKKTGKDKVEISKPVKKKVTVLKTSCKNKEAVDDYIKKLSQDKDEPKPKKKLDW
jgi:hypothetical protein